MTTCEKCDGDGWVWDEEEGGSFDCTCVDEPGYLDSRNQVFHDERHEPDHPMPMKWQDCERCAVMHASF